MNQQLRVSSPTHQPQQEMEVPLVGSDAVQWIQVKVPAQFTPSLACFPPSQDSAGTCSIWTPAFRLFIWRLHGASPAVLELLEISVEQGVPRTGLQLLFEEPLSPFVTLFVSRVHHQEEVIYLCAVATSGAVYFIRLKDFQHYESGSILAQSETVQFCLSSEVSRLDRIRAFAAAGGYLCVGGQNGSIICYPLGQLEDVARSLPFELRDGDARLGRLWGLVTRVKAAGAIETLSLQSIHGRMILFALHEDGGFRLWDLADRRRLFSCNLSSMIGSLAQRMWIQESGPNTVFLQLAFHFSGRLETSRDMIQFYDLNFNQGDGAMSQSLLIPQRVLHCEHGKVVDVKMFADRFWVLQDLGVGSFAVVQGNTKREAASQYFVLLEEEIADQLLQGPDYDWDDLALICRTVYPDTKDTLGPPLSQFFLSRLLQPGVFQQTVLREVLEAHGRQVNESDLFGITRDGLRKEILAAIDAESYGDNELQLIREWKSFCMDYLISWKSNNVPYGLLLDSSTGALGLIRKRSLSILRSVGGVEQLFYGRIFTEKAKMLSVPLDWQGESNDVGILDSLNKCMGNISKHLGKMALAVFHQTLLGPKHVSVPHLTSSLLQLLDLGYRFSVFSHVTSHMGVDNARKKRKVLHLRQRKFQLHMLIALQALRDIGGGWERVVDVIGKYLQYFVHDMKLSNVRITAMNSGRRNKNRRLLTTATSQVVWVQFEAARDLLLLLGYIVNVKGQVGIGPNEIAKIQLDLIPRVRELLMLTLLLHWLTITFADRPPTEDFSLRLSSLNIDGSGSNKALDRRSGTGELTVAEILLSSFSSSSYGCQTSDFLNILSAEALLNSAKEFVYWLVWDDQSDQLSFFSKRLLTLSTILLQHGQYGVLENFLSTIEGFLVQQEVLDNSPNNNEMQSAHMHLLGFCLLARARTSLHDTLKEEQVGGAIRCFFTAASGLGEAKDILQTLFLQTGLQIAMPDSGAAAAWKLHYFEWVMQIFEQCSFSEGACQFAHAALEQVDEAVGAFGGVSVEESNIDSLAAAIKGRLWANVFKFSLDLELYTDAYSAIISNPDSESKYICLRRFIVVLCERKATEVLCGLHLPYAGMLDRVEQELAWKAEYSDIMAKPNPYKILYSFYVHRHDLRQAAYYMYRYALRLKDEGTSKGRIQVNFSLQEQLNGLLAAINALRLVDPLYAWIDMQSESNLSMQIRQSPTKRARVDEEEDKNKSRIIDIQNLEEQYMLTLAKLQLVQANVKHPLLGSTLPVGDVLMLLVQAGFYEMGFSLLLLFWKDSSLKWELEKVFQVMAEKCCARQLQTGCSTIDVANVEPSNKLLLLTSSADVDVPVTFSVDADDSGAKENLFGSNNWKTLHMYLEKYKGLHIGLPAVVAETILSVDRLIELPVWLVDMFKGGRHAAAQGMAGHGADPAALLRIYLDFGRLTEATRLLLEYMQAWATLSPADVIKRKRMCDVWFPYTLVDRLKFHIYEQRNSDQCEHLQNLLGSSLQRHLNQIHIDSNDIASLIQQTKT